MVFFIIYSPIFPLTTNSALIEKVKSYSDVYPLSKNAFLVYSACSDSLEEAKKIRTDLEPICGNNGMLYVGEMGSHAAWIGYNSEKMRAWLYKNLSSGKHENNTFSIDQITSNENIQKRPLDHPLYNKIDLKKDLLEHDKKNPQEEGNKSDDVLDILKKTSIAAIVPQESENPSLINPNETNCGDKS